MLRSIGRAPCDVAVEGGAENVCEPRLQKLPPRPARVSVADRHQQHRCDRA
jgi:hypothetical protein